MTKFRVGVANAAHTEGAETITVNAPDEATAKTIYAALGGSTVEAMAEAGLTEWKVEELA